MIGKDKESSKGKDNLKKAAILPVLKIIGRRHSSFASSNGGGGGEDLFDGLGGSLWTCIMAMTEDMLTTAMGHAAISSKIQDSVVRPYVENIELVEEQVKMNAEGGRKMESLKKSDIGKQEEGFIADEMAKVYQSFRNIEEWRQQIVKKVVDEYSDIRVSQADIALAQRYTPPPPHHHQQQKRD